MSKNKYFDYFKFGILEKKIGNIYFSPHIGPLAFSTAPKSRLLKKIDVFFKTILKKKNCPVRFYFIHEGQRCEISKINSTKYFFCFRKCKALKKKIMFCPKNIWLKFIWQLFFSISIFVLGCFCWVAWKSRSPRTIYGIPEIGISPGLYSVNVTECYPKSVI